MIFNVDVKLDNLFCGIPTDSDGEQIGPKNEAPGVGPIPMKLEAWPGGRWYRDLGNGAGHF
jgi:hypothetical protein